MKKSICAALAAVLLLTFTGCAATGTTDPTESTAPSTTAATKPTEASTGATIEPTVAETEPATEPETEPVTEAPTGASAEIPTEAPKKETSNTGANSSGSSTSKETEPKETKPAETKPVETIHDHSWGEWTTTKEATTEAEGEQTRTCATCGATETKAIERLAKEVIDAASLAAYARSVAAGLGMQTDTSMGKGNSGYYPGVDYPVTTMDEGRAYAAACAQSVYARMKYAEEQDGHEFDPSLVRFNCLVEYEYTDDQGRDWYIFWGFYG